MRTRLLASTLLGLALLASIGVGSTLAKGTVETFDVNDSFCFQGDPELYCSVQEGTMTIVTKDDGSSVGRLDAVVTVEITINGDFVASYTTVTQQTPDRRLTAAIRSPGATRPTGPMATGRATSTCASRSSTSMWSVTS